MWKYIQTLPALLFIASIACAQDQRHAIDSMYKRLQKVPGKDKAALYVAIANEYRNISGDTTLIYAKKGVAVAREHKNLIAEAGGYSIIGTVYKNRGDFESSLKYQLKGLKIAEQLNDGPELASSYNNIGILYKKMRRWDEALPYYIKANHYAKRFSKKRTVALTYNNIGTIYLEKKMWDKVESYYDTAWKLANESGDTYAMATVLANMADLYLGQEKYDKAIKVTKQCLGYDKANEDKYGMFMSYFQLARAYSQLQDYSSFELYADSAEHIARTEQLNRELIDLISWKSTVSLLRKDTATAFRFYHEARTINDSILTEATAKQVSELQTQYETEKKEQKIALQQSELSRKNFIIVAICAVMLLIVLLAYSYYNRYRLKQQTKLQKAVMREQELATEAVIEAEEKERKRIAGDLHDGVGQLMSAARMNLSLVANEVKFENVEQKAAFEKALSLVDDSCKEVRAVSHNIMPNALLKAGLASAIRDFLHKIDHRVLEVNLYADGMNDRLPPNIEMVLYRVVQECVNNVIKHSGASKLDITLIKDEEGISVTVEDNGQGFNPAEKHAEDAGIGLKNIQTRIHYLKGTIEWDTAPGKGTVVMINVPQV